MALILMYHGVGDQAAPNAELRYTVSQQRFLEQLQVLEQRPVVSLARLLDGRAGPEAVVLSFDDGEKTVVETALPLLAARGWTGILYVTTGWIGSPGYCDEQDLRELAGAGWEIGAHGVTHRFLSELDDRELQHELTEARRQLASILGAPIEHLSLPGGRGDRRVREAARAAGYGSLATSVVGRNQGRLDGFSLRRVGVQRGHQAAYVQRLAAGDRRLLFELRARQELLDGAKRLLGNQRYVALRGLAARLMGGRPA